MITNTELMNECNAAVRHIIGKVELYEGSTLVNTFNHNDRLISFTIERVGEEKFFGFGVCQKINVKLIDRYRELSITTANSFKVYFNDVCTCPLFYVTEVNRDEKTNELSITAYDALYEKPLMHTTSEINITSEVQLFRYLNEFSRILGLKSTIAVSNSAWNDGWTPSQVNFEGTEDMRTALNALAEITQSIYYMDSNNALAFKYIDKNASANLTIDKSKYFELDTSDNRRISKIVSCTELGDNVSAELAETGTTVYIRENPFWNNNPRVGILVDNALNRVGRLTIGQFECQWRGNPLLEVGDKIALITKDNDTVYSYVINDTIEYNGSLSQKTQWRYEEDETETEDNPSSLGDAINKTYARVDKVNKEITLLASEVSDTKSEISEVKQTVSDINLTIKSTVQEEVKKEIGSVSLNVYTIVLSNEAQTIAVDVNRMPLKSETFYTDIQVYEGSNVRTDYSIGNIPSANGITVTKTSSRVNFAVSNSTILGADNGQFIIPITIDDKTFNKTFSWSCAKQGTAGTNGTNGTDGKDGVDGEDAKALSLHATSQIFTSINGETYDPTTITLTAKLDNLTFSKWQYSLDGTSFTDVVNGSNGLHTNGTTLVIDNTSDLFSDTISSVVFKALSTINEYYDTMTITKVLDLSEQLKDVQGQVIQNKDAITSLQLNTDSISASVKQVEENVIQTVDGVIANIDSLTEKVNATMTADAVKLEIQKELSAGVDKVTTSTGFTFNEDGLTINKTDSEMNTQITEDGMKIYKNEDIMLTANNQGVDAKNLHATTYLIIGGNSRMEDFTCDGTKRTAVFWIGSDN